MMWLLTLMLLQIPDGSSMATADQMVVLNAKESENRTLVLPHSYDGNVDTRCVIVYPREGSLGWLIDREENTASLFYLNMPWPGFCDERGKKKEKKKK